MAILFVFSGKRFCGRAGTQEYGEIEEAEKRTCSGKLIKCLIVDSECNITALINLIFC